MERHEPHGGPGEGATGAPPEPAPGEGERRVRGRHLGGGWRVMDGCRLTSDGPPVEIVLAHRALGLAIMELEPRWTPAAEQLLQERLTAAGFFERFPGHLPIIHRRLRREVLGELPMVLTEAFSWQDPLTIPAELDWIEGLREALVAADPAAPTRAPAPGSAMEAPAVADGAEREAASGPPAPSGPADPSPVVHAPPLAALAAAMGTSGATPVAANAPDKPASAAAAPARGGRSRLVVGGAALAAGIALAVVLSRQPAPELPVAEAGVQMAAATGGASPVLTPSAGATPARAPPATDAPSPSVVRLEVVAPFVEAEVPRLEIAEAVLAAQLSPEPLAPFAEPEAPRLEIAEAVLAAQLSPEPLAPFAEPEAPRLEAAEAVLAAQLSPEPLTPFAEPEAPRLEAAEAVLAAQLPPEPIAPFAEPEAPRLDDAERALADALVAPSVAAPAAPAAVAAPPTPAAAAPPASSMAPEMVEMLLRRGRDLMGIGDVSAARRFFERAAAGGSGEAALEAGATYDPRVLRALGARGIPPDREAALTWYRRAAALGVAAAEARIRALEAMP